MEDFYKTILDNIPADVVAFDTEHNYQYINKNAIKNDELRNWLIGKKDEDYFKLKGIIDEKFSRRREYFEKCLTTALPQSFVEKYDLSDDKKQFQLRIYNPVLKNGKIKLVVGYGIDITSLTETEQREQILQTAIETAPDGIAILNAEGIYTYMNTAHSKIFGAPNKEYFIGKKWNTIYQKEEINRITNEVFPELYKYGNWTGITTGFTLNGLKLIQQVNLTLLPDNGLICICKDIMHDLKQKADLQKLAFIASKTNSMVILSDTEGNIQWVNEAFERTMQYKLEEIYGQNPSFLHGPETKNSTIKTIFDAIKQEKSFEGEMISYTKNGKKIYLYINLTPVFNEDNVLTNYISVENDITTLKIAENKKRIAELKQREFADLKADFVSLVSHELRTPLAIIKSSTEILSEIINQNEDKSEFWSKIKKHTKRVDVELDKMAQLTNRILTLNKINAGKLDFRPSKTNINLLLEEIKDLYTDFTTNLPEFNLVVIGKPYQIKIDKNLMEQVLRNLISNAIKFSKNYTNQLPEVRLEFLENHIQIEVKDYGIGMPENSKKRIFEDFYRASNVHQIPGSGIGLSLVKKILDLHKANYDIETQEKEGFKFKILLKRHYATS